MGTELWTRHKTYGPKALLDKKKKKNQSWNLLQTVINFIIGYLLKEVSDKIVLWVLFSLHRVLIKEENK